MILAVLSSTSSLNEGILRKCVGESLAVMELFLVIANLFNQYEVCAAHKPCFNTGLTIAGLLQIQPGNNLPSLTRKMGATVACPPFTCRLVRRQA